MERNTGVGTSARLRDAVFLITMSTQRIHQKIIEVLCSNASGYAQSSYATPEAGIQCHVNVLGTYYSKLSEEAIWTIYT